MVLGAGGEVEGLRLLVLGFGKMGNDVEGLRLFVLGV